MEAVLEQLQGMSVIKSFNLTGKGDKRVRQAMEDSRNNNLAIEKLFTPYTMAQEMVLHLFSIFILVAAVLLCLSNAISLANALMAVVVSFLIFFPDSIGRKRRVRLAPSGEAPLTTPIKWTAFQKWMNMGKQLSPKSMTLPLNM